MPKIASTTRQRTKASKMPYQSNKLSFPVIRKATDAHDDRHDPEYKPSAPPPKKTRKTRHRQQKNTLALPVLPSVSFSAGRGWIMLRVRAYIKARQSGDQDEVDDYLMRLKVAYRMDFPLGRLVWESLDDFEDRQVADIERTLMPLLDYGVSKFLFLFAKTPWTLPTIENIEIPEPSPIRSRPRPSWNRKRVVADDRDRSLVPANQPHSPPAGSPPPDGSSVSSIQSPYQFASPAPTLSSVDSGSRSISPFDLSSPIPFPSSESESASASESESESESFPDHRMDVMDDDEPKFTSDVDFDAEVRHFINDWCFSRMSSSDSDEEEVGEILAMEDDSDSDDSVAVKVEADDAVKVEVDEAVKVEASMKVEGEDGVANGHAYDAFLEESARIGVAVRAEHARRATMAVPENVRTRGVLYMDSAWGVEF